MAGQQVLQRRAFLGQGLACVAAASGLAWGADPIARNGKPYFKTSLAAYSWNRMLPRNKPLAEHAQAAMDLFRFLDFCAAHDLAGAELTSYYFPADVDRDYLLRLKAHAFALGLDVSGTAIGNDFCVAGAEERAQQLTLARTWIDRAAVLGAPVIRIFAGKVPKGDTEEAARERCISAIHELLPYAESQGVVLALENHGGITATPEQLLAIVAGVQASPAFGVNFDSGNFVTAEPYADLAKIAPYAMNAQLKVEMKPNGKAEPADFARILDILRRAAYRGYVVLEYEAAEDPYDAIPRHLDVLKRLMAAGV